jgi:hypothetical protein
MGALLEDLRDFVVLVLLLDGPGEESYDNQSVEMDNA